MPDSKRGWPVRPRTYDLLANAWGVSIGLLAIYAAVVHFLFPGLIPGDPAVTQALGNWDEVYFAMYGAAGVLMIYGLARPHREADVLGLCLLGSGILIQFVAAAYVFGWDGAVRGVPTLLTFGVAAWCRVLVLARFVRPRYWGDDG